MQTEDFVRSQTPEGESGLVDHEHPALVLVADPDERSLDAYSSVLREGGFAVAAVADERSALAATGQSLSAIVISHLSSAGSAALGLCRQLRATASTRDVPMIVLTSSDDEHTREQIVRAGATAIMVEPLKRGLLVRRLRRLITTTRRRRGLA